MTPEQKAQVLELHGQRPFARDVAEEVGVTRNAVLGMWWRNGLSAPTQSSRTRRHNRDAVERKLEGRGEKLARIMAIMRRKGMRLARMERNHCRYVISGAGADATFCGRLVRPESSYCPEHHAVCWRPVGPKPKSTFVMQRNLRAGNYR